MSYLFWGYSIIWAVVASYIVVLGRRQTQLKKDIEQIIEWEKEQ